MAHDGRPPGARLDRSSFHDMLAPHGPPDVSPVGRAVTVALDVSSPSFGIQEAADFSQTTLDVFPGAIVAQDGAVAPPETPGLGVDFNEHLARSFPAPEPLGHDRWALLRNRDGSVQRP